MLRLIETIDRIIAKYKYRGSVKVNMFCPACKTRLHMMDKARRYETLSEHVSDPNATPIHKPIFMCLTNNCPVNIKTGAYYGIDGGLYSKNTNPKEYWDAIGGLSYHVEKDMKKRGE